MYKVCIIGPSNHGKSEFISLLENMINDEGKRCKFVNSLGVEVHKIHYGSYIFNMWDISDEKCQGLKNKYFNCTYFIIAFEGYNEEYEKYLKRTRHMIIPYDTEIEINVLDNIIPK